jgi:hypothetical protein
MTSHAPSIRTPCPKERLPDENYHYFQKKSTRGIQFMGTLVLRVNSEKKRLTDCVWNAIYNSSSNRVLEP